MILIIWLALASNAYSISLATKQKYPYPLLTDDYGVLTDNDVAAYAWGLKPRPFTPDEISGGYTYWQCFPREYISITLEDTGYSSEDIGWEDNYGDLRIHVQINPQISHEYEMRSRWPVRDFERRFTTWRKMMKNEKYICLAGGFSDRKRKLENGKTQEIYSWTFEKIKTKKGCDSYFDRCHPTYKQYLKDQAESQRLSKGLT
ncbi:MAG: hypothetical protein ACYCQI_01365 [Gammaproteobacteria bacterium]